MSPSTLVHITCTLTGTLLYAHEVAVALRTRLAIPVLSGAHTCLTGAVPGCGRYDPLYGEAASDRMARVCRCGGYFAKRHDGMRDAQVGVLQHYGVFARIETREWLPGKRRMDVSVPAAHTSGGTVAGDLTIGGSFAAGGG